MSRSKPYSAPKLPLAERETIITFNEGEPYAHVSTMNPAMMRKLKSYAEQHEEVQFISEDEYGVNFVLPKYLVSIRKPYVMSEQARKEASERMSLLNRQGSQQ